MNNSDFQREHLRAIHEQTKSQEQVMFGLMFFLGFLFAPTGFGWLVGLAVLWGIGWLVFVTLRGIVQAVCEDVRVVCEYVKHFNSRTSLRDVVVKLAKFACYVFLGMVFIVLLLMVANYLAFNLPV